MKPETAIDKIVEEIINSGLIHDRNINEGREFLKDKCSMVGAVYYIEGISYSTLKKSVVQYDKNGKFMKEFLGAADAQRKTGIHRVNICQVCMNKRKTAGGYKWKYLK